MRRGRGWIAAAVAASVVTLASGDAEASGIEGCFRESQAFAMCNGFIAGLAGLGSISGPILALADTELGGGMIALSVGLGIYAGASGAALIASSQVQDPAESSTRDSGTALGVVTLVAGGSGLILSGVAGIILGVKSSRDSDGEDSEARRQLTMAPMVAGASGPAPGLTIGSTF